MRGKLRLILVLFTLTSLVVAVAGCSNKTTTSEPGQTIREISVTEANTLIQENGGNPDFVIIDVRTPSEYASGYIEGAVLINFEDAAFRTEIGKLDKSKRYLVYCRTSNRSGQAVAIMKDLGFKEIYDMDGGIVAWQAAGLPVIK